MNEIRPAGDREPRTHDSIVVLHKVELAGFGDLDMVDKAEGGFGSNFLVSANARIPTFEKDCGLGLECIDLEVTFSGNVK